MYEVKRGEEIENVDDMEALRMVHVALRPLQQR